MTTFDNKNTESNLARTISETQWLKKRKAILEKQSSNNADMETLHQQKAKLMNDISILEEKNHALKQLIKEQQVLLPEKKRDNVETLKKVETHKNQLSKYLSTERNLISEIAFYENEQQQLDNMLKDLTQKLNTSIGAIDDTLMNIDFVKGEIKAMLNKMTLLETNIPKEYEHMDQLDGLFQQTILSLNDLYNRAHHAENNVKKTYYKIKHQRRDTQ